MKIAKLLSALVVATQLLSLQTSTAAGNDGQDLVGTAPGAPLASIADQAEACDPDAMGEKIKEKAKTLSDNICVTSEIANRDSTGFFANEKKDFYAKQCDRTREMVNDPGYASSVAAMGKSQKNSSCYVVEIDSDNIGDNDGICTQNEKIKGGCQEALGDGIGDDLACEEITLISDQKGKKVKTWEPCEEVCIISVEEAADGCDQLAAIDGLLEDTNSELSDLNAQISVKLQELTQQQALSTEIQGDENEQAANTCNDVLQVAITSENIVVPIPLSLNFTGRDRPDTWNTSVGFYHATELADLAANACDDWTASIDPDGPGPAGHPQFICGWAHLTKSIASEFSNLSSMLDDEITATRIDNMAACLEQLGQSNAALEAKLDEIIRLLNTPQGQRSAFPTK